MIEQAYVQADDETAPTVKNIRERISTAVDATTGTALERLKCWLQMPVDSTFAKMSDSDCQVRAKRIGGLLSPGEGGLYEPSDLSVAIGVPAKWTAIDKAVKAERAVYVNGSTGHVGGAQSKFNNERNAGFHVIVFLAVGQESEGRGYYLGFDPDVSATTESRAAWKALVTGDPETKPQDFTATKSLEVIKSMILGSSEGGFGPLVRKYYVDTGKAFPKIIRA
ncbi:hypothetical protein BCL76_11512 [Streptomyces sp. CG 926]|uniref:hypothetical protein n=1 Tax=Streptomyces sp. CG 926 TaxID=1882405 RepID=UPI000D6CB0FA|nr:hypothetical protein [Streptomyces sp. CG 926]PWK64369.1 hypothetical protein BCL76_11512 [Streptomyces sp. CG 926]